MLEPLESRIAPAGLHGAYEHGVLTITGAPFGTTLTISEQAGGGVKIEDSGGTGFNPLFGINTILVLLSSEAANDTIDLHFDQGFVHTLVVKPGTGNSTVNFDSGGSHLTATVTAGAGNDTVDIRAAANVHAVHFNAGNGDNRLDIEGHAGIVTFAGGSGVDTLTLSSSVSVGTLTASLGAGDDAMNLNGTVRGKATLKTGVEGGTIDIASTTSLGALTVVGGADSDFVTVAGHIAGLESISTGAGNDNVTLQPSSSARILGVSLGAGLDTMYLGGSYKLTAGAALGADMDTIHLTNGLSVGGALGISLGAGNNFLVSDTATSSQLGTAGSISIVGSSGDDSVTLEGFQVTHGVSVNLGDGANSFQIPNRIAGSEIAALIATKLTYTGGKLTDSIAIASSQSMIGSGVFNLGAGDDTVTFTSSQSIFTSSLKTYGSTGDDTFIGKSLFTGITTVYSGVEHSS